MATDFIVTGMQCVFKKQIWHNEFWHTIGWWCCAKGEVSLATGSGGDAGFYASWHGWRRQICITYRSSGEQIRNHSWQYSHRTQIVIELSERWSHTIFILLIFYSLISVAQNSGTAIRTHSSRRLRKPWEVLFCLGQKNIQSRFTCKQCFLNIVLSIFSWSWWKIEAL